MRCARVDLDLVVEPGRLQLAGKGRDVVHGDGAVGAAVGDQERRHIGGIALSFRGGQAAVEGSVAGNTFGLPRACHFEHRCRSEEQTSALQSLMRISYAVFCLKKKTTKI